MSHKLPAGIRLYFVTLAFIGLVFVVSVSGCTVGNKVKSFAGSDNNKTVTVKAGETFKITLDENPTTGYEWNVSTTSGLTLKDLGYTQEGSPELAGAGGTHAWEVTSTGAGNQTFSGIYKRPWEQTEGNERTYRLNVTIV